MPYHSPKRERRGAVLGLIPAFLVMFIVLAILMVDLGYLFTVKSRLHSAADAASLAGALRLRDALAMPNQVRQSAIQFAELNQPGIKKVLKRGDVEIGEWDPEFQVFTRGGFEPNAVRVTVRRTSKQSVGVPTFFAKLFRPSDLEAAVTSVAAFTIDEDDDGNDLKSMPFVVE